MTHHHNAESAINHSVRSGEIVTINVSELECSYCADLLEECEDHVENGNVHEFWGTNDDGEWRVHVRATYPAY